MADNLLDKASILLTPTAYDNGSMLSIKPDNGDGDFDFERNSAATRVNAQGLVENVQIISPELVSNGNFSQIGTEEVLNGNFSQEGSELVTNGSFDTDSNWNKGTGWSISGGKASCDGSQTSNSLFFQNIGSLANKTVKFSFTLSNYVSGQINTAFFSASGTTSYVASANGDYTFYIDVASGHNGNTGFTANSDFIGSIDNVSVKEVGQNWSLGSGWSIGEDKAVRVGTSAGNLTQSPFTIGKTYKVSWEQSNGFIAVYGNALSTLLSNTGDEGTRTVYFTPTSSTRLDFRSTDDDAEVTNISVKEVGQDWSIIDSDADNYVEFNQTQGTARLKFLNTSPLTKLQSTAQYISGKKYKLIVDVAEVVSGGIKIDAAGVSQTYNSVGIQEAIIEPTGTQFIAFYRATADVDITLNSISVKEITDDTNIPRINYEGFSYQDTLGSEEVVNGDFSVDSNWNKGTSWSITNGKAICNGGGNYLQQQPIVFEVGKTYKCEFDIIDYTSGTVRFRLSTSNNGSELSGKGSYTEYITIVSKTDNYLNIIGSSFIGSIDNVSVKEVTGQEVVPDSGCGSWLLEPQSTNLATYSEDFSNSYWTKTGASLSSSFASPSGDLSAFKLVEDTSTGVHGLTAVVSGLTIGNTHTISIYAKSGENNYMYMRFRYAGNTNVMFDLVNGTIGVSGSNVLSKSIEPMTNGYYKCTITASAPTSTEGFRIYSSSNGTDISYTGDGTSGIYIWGAQVEQQSYATSYIPTNGATNTRLQDIADNSGNSSLINSTEGTLYAEANLIDGYDNNNFLATIFDNSNGGGNHILIQRYLGNIQSKIKVGTTQAEITESNTTTGNKKIAFTYKVNEFKMFINGSQVGSTDTSGSVFSADTLDNINLGSYYNGTLNFNSGIKALAVYKEALTDANLRSLTYPNPVATTFDLDFDTIAEQFTFTRGSEATFVNEQGLIESTNQIGSELVTNGDFATDSNWSKGTGWSIENGVATLDGTQTSGSSLGSNIMSVVSGKTYKIVVNVLSTSSGFRLYDSDGVLDYSLSVGENVFYKTVSSSSYQVTPLGLSGTIGSIDNVSVKEYTTATNTPRIDYSTGAKAFLLEPQSTNLITYSEDFSQWTLGSNATLSYESDIVAPDGSLGVYRLTLPTQSSTFLLSNSFTGKNPLASSIYAKSAATNNDFNLFDGSITSSLKTATSEWQRFDYIGSGSQLGIVNQGDTFITDIYIWGAQAENQSYATSYIPTSGASATRNQELCVDATPVINSEEGTLYAEISALANDGTFRMISISDGTNNNRVRINYTAATNQIAARVVDSGNTQADFTHTLTDSSEFVKLAISYKNNDCTFWVNGTKVGTDTSATMPSGLDTLSLNGGGGSPFFGNTKDLKYYPKALADVQLEDLTTI